MLSFRVTMLPYRVMTVSYFLLNRVRLTHYLYAFTVIFYAISLLLPKIELGGAALTLFSVNSFLYGFYLSPIIRAQQARVNQLKKTVGTEVGKLDEVVQYSKRMEEDFQLEIVSMVKKYCKIASTGDVYSGDKEMKQLVAKVVEYSGDKKDPHKEMMKSVFAAQQSRMAVRTIAEDKVYSNEWTVMTILFAITISFILLTRLPEAPLLGLIPAVLCAGLSMLIVILVKMSTLTHKKAKSAWQPLKDYYSAL